MPLARDFQRHARRTGRRLYTSKHLRRLLPSRIAVPLTCVAVVTLRRWTEPEEEPATVDLFTDLLQFTSRADDARKVARRYLWERRFRSELFWRPWLLNKSRIHGLQHWDAACEGRRGCVLVVAHVGGSWTIPRTLQSVGRPVTIVGHAGLWEEADNLDGAVKRFLRQEYQGAAAVPNSTSPDEVAAIVQGGGTTIIAFDVPGSAPTPFLGRSVSFTSGPASLARLTGVKVVPTYAKRRGHIVDVHMLPALDPADFSDIRAFRAAIAQVFEPIILASPECVEDPSLLMDEIPVST